MNSWKIIYNVRILDKDSAPLLIEPFPWWARLGATSSCAAEPAPVHVTVKSPDVMRITRAAVAVGQIQRPPVDLLVSPISSGDIVLAERYHAALFTAGRTLEPIDLTPDSLAAARQHFEERRANRLDAFGRPRRPQLVGSADDGHAQPFAAGVKGNSLA